MTSSAPRASREPGLNGWILFAAILLIIAGILDALWGLAAILNDEVVTVGGRGVAVWDFTAWGWAHLIIGSLMALTGFGLFAGNQAARWLAVFFASLNALLQFGIFTAFPLWSITIIALNVVIIYQLSARWDG
jgi:uncharacterized membrane protein